MMNNKPISQALEPIPEHVNTIGITRFHGIHLDDGRKVYALQEPKLYDEWYEELKDFDVWELYSAGETDAIPGHYYYKKLFSRRDNCPECGQNRRTPNMYFCDVCDPRPATEPEIEPVESDNEK